MTNLELHLASEYVSHTDKNIFLTGKAGTGKTTFLQQLNKNCAKRMIITAPTGVAAMNAGGTTLHSFFQIPFAPYLPGTALEIHRFRKNKIDIIKSLNLLVIDEISMVRADVLDSIDVVLRRFRDKTLPFGGVQLLMIGDLHQLPPIVTDNEWNILKPHYQSVYFFNSHALKQTDMIRIELQQIYRQNDPEFIGILNSIRENNINEDSLEKLNARYIPDFQPSEDQKYITLSSHNHIADTINSRHMQALGGDTYTLEANIADNFPTHIFPTEQNLILKVGAQVMFVRNDQSSEKRYFNGKIGKIVKIADESILVECPGDNSPIKVEAVTWKNITYNIDDDKQKIVENVLGSFTQYPLRLAWAITIHKSQGLTFEHAIIDAQSSFSHGQVYVALSRCKSLQGLVLSKPILRRSIINDLAISNFSHENRTLTPTMEQLENDKNAYYKKMALECFSFVLIDSSLSKLKYLISNRQNQIQFNGLIPVEHALQQFRQEIGEISNKFAHQLSGLFSQCHSPSDDIAIQERIQKASNYFSEKLKHGLSEWLITANADIENKETRKQFEKQFTDLSSKIGEKRAALKSCENRFSTQDYLAAISTEKIKGAENKSRTKQKQATPTDVKHIPLYQALTSWRDEQAATEGIVAYRILHLKVIKRIANELPRNKSDLLELEGIGPKTLQKYGEELLSIIDGFSHTFPSKEEVKDVKKSNSKKRKNNDKESVEHSETQQASFNLYRSGKNIAEIAAARGLTKGTIETHLEHYVNFGLIDIKEFVIQEKAEVIKNALENCDTGRASDVKVMLGDDYSYFEIRLVKNMLPATEKDLP